MGIGCYFLHSLSLNHYKQTLFGKVSSCSFIGHKPHLCSCSTSFAPAVASSPCKNPHCWSHLLPSEDPTVKKTVSLDNLLLAI